MVICIVAIVMILGTAAMTLIDNQTAMVSHNVKSEDALHIAEAGYNNYLWHLNDNSQFYKTGVNVADGLDPETTYTASENPLWAGFPKKYKVTEYKNGSVLLGYYQLFITPPSTEEPVVTITSTGWTVSDPSNKRSIEVKIHKRTFTNYVDFSGDMKTVDGDKIYWGDGEHAKGPVFTNGTLRTIGKPTFHSDVGYVVGTEYINGGPPIFKIAGQPKKMTALQFPSSNASLKDWGDPANGGYTYTGRTCIMMNDASLRICNVNVNGDDPVDRSLPGSGVIYVNGEVYISGTLQGRLTVVAENNIYITGKDPTVFHTKKNSYNNAGSTGGITYKNQDILTMDNPNPSNLSNDMLGLVSNGVILIHSKNWPRKGGGVYTWDDLAVPNIKVQAAIFGLSSNSYYGVQDYEDLGNMGYIYFTGSKVSSRVGATYTSGWGSIHGYKENNSFDYRMAYDAPPHFLEPVNSGWEVKAWKEVANP